MGDGGVEQRAGELRADRVVHLEPAAVEHGLRGGREPQQPGGRTAEQGRALTEHLHPAIDLDGEPVGQPRPSHVSIPSRSGAPPGDPPRTSVDHLGEEPFTVLGRCGRRVSEDAEFAHGGDAAADASAASARPAVRGCRGGARRPTRRSAKYVAIQTFRCGRRGHRRSRRYTNTSLTSRPSYRSKAAAAASASTFPPWPLTKTRRDAHCARRSAELHQQKPQRRGPDRDGAGEALVFAARAVADRGRKDPIGFIAVGEPVSNRASDGGGDPGIGVQRQVGSMLFDRTYRDNQRGRRALQLSRR